MEKVPMLTPSKIKVQLWSRHPETRRKSTKRWVEWNFICFYLVFVVYREFVGEMWIITLAKCNAATASPDRIVLCQGIPYSAPVDGQSICTPSPHVSSERRIRLAHETHLSLPSSASHSQNSQWIRRRAICHWSLVHVHRSWPIHDPRTHFHRLQWQSCSQYRSIHSCWCAAVEYFSFVANTNPGQNMPHRPYDARLHMVLDKSVAAKLLPRQPPIPIGSRFSDILNNNQKSETKLREYFRIYWVHDHFYHRTL